MRMSYIVCFEIIFYTHVIRFLNDTDLSTDSLISGSWNDQYQTATEDPDTLNDQFVLVWGSSLMHIQNPSRGTRTFEPYKISSQKYVQFYVVLLSKLTQL